MKYPIGIQSFDQLREDGFVYVDKTALVYDLVSNGKIYFLSRPRRFGKSLLISTLKHYFLGHKELFQGLAIEQLEKDWNAYPAVRTSLSPISWIKCWRGLLPRVRSVTVHRKHSRSDSASARCCKRLTKPLVAEPWC